MVSATEIQLAVEVLRSFGARRIVLFGSSVHYPETANDLDLACSGIPSALFYRAAARVMSQLRRDIDLVDLSLNHPRTRLIERTGKVLYAA